MKWPRLVRMSVIAGIVPASMFLFAYRGEADDKEDSEILQAYMAVPEFAAERDSLRSHGYVDYGARTMLVSGSCGVAGCYYEYLVVHLFSHAGTNPQSRSILARVRGGPRGEVGRVERVELKETREQPVGEGESAPDRKFRVVPTAPPEPNQ
jgi:hypothetical protein